LNAFEAGRRTAVQHSFLAHDEADHVAVAVRDVGGGDEVEIAFLNSDKRVRLESHEDVPLGHKIALRDVEEGAEVLKYGIPIGRATTRLRTGDYVHTHNLRTARW
jgi:(2R)-sulfolactate sulfo-lyase subunit alpha